MMPKMKEQDAHPALLTDEESNPYVPSPQSTGDRSEEGYSDSVELTEEGMICHERTIFPPVCVVSGETENLVIMPLTPTARSSSSGILRLVAFGLLLFPAIVIGGFSLLQILFNISFVEFFQLLPWTIVASITSLPFFIAAGFGHIKCAFQLSLGQKAHQRWKTVNRIAGLSGFLPAVAIVLSNAAPGGTRLLIWGPFILWMLVLLPILKRWQLNGLTTIRVKALESGLVEVTGLSREFRNGVQRILDANKSAHGEGTNVG
jgi:hypothetical protein